jgi:ornithine cyclodeaminase/alanine dehydrogenase-like protein (mu-crystallin family)
LFGYDARAAIAMLFISADRLRKAVSMLDAIEAVRRAYLSVSAGTVEQPTRLVLERGSALAMMARNRESGTTVLKALTIRPDNPTVGLPAIQALVILFDGKTGKPRALIDGTSLTALRTGAASGVGTALLAPKDSHVLGMIGAGAQGADQIRAVCSVRPITEVRIYSRTAARALQLAVRLSDELPKVQFVPVDAVGDAVSDADVICTATPSTSPLFEANLLKPTVHVNAVGAFTPQMCELPPELLRDARIVAIDEYDAAMVEAGDLLQAIDHGYLTSDRLVEIGKLLTNPPSSQTGWTVFKSVGIAAQDLEVAEVAANRARESDDIPWS